MPMPKTMPIREPRKNRAASWLLQLYSSSSAAHRPPPPPNAQPIPPPIRVVCVANTRGDQPELPPGDILIHAGSLTHAGTFVEMQQGLTWLSSQPHRYKVYVAGDRDELLDDKFTLTHHCREGVRRNKWDLDWGTVEYLQDTHAELKFPERDRTVVVVGSPWSLGNGKRPFQYVSAGRAGKPLWNRVFGKLDRKPDVVVTPSPPHGILLDVMNRRPVGCPHLASHIHRLRPRLHVFGCERGVHGRKDVPIDTVRKARGRVVAGEVGWPGVAWMASLLVWGVTVGRVVRWGKGSVTAFVNASVASEGDFDNDAVVVEI